MFKKWNERGRYTHRLPRRYVHVVHIIRVALQELTLIASQHTLRSKFVVIGQFCIGLGDPEVLFIIGGTIIDLEGDKGLDPHFSILDRLRQFFKQGLIDAHPFARLDEYLAIGSRHIFPLSPNHATEFSADQTSVIGW